MSEIKVGEKRYVGGWMGFQFGDCIVTNTTVKRVYFVDIDGGAQDSMPHKDWLERMPSRRQSTQLSHGLTNDQINRAVDTLVQAAILTGEDWSGYVADRTGTQDDLYESERFRADLVNDPRMLLSAIKEMNEDD